MVGKAHLVLLSLLLVLVLLVPAVPAVAAVDRLPDLRMAHLRDLTIDNTADGRRLLRFTAVVVNTGVGAFELQGQRPDTSTAEMSVQQRIYDDVGGSRSMATPAKMYFGGDGHNHWHVRNLQRYELERRDNGVKVGTGVKSGFCFYDNEPYQLTLAGAPQAPMYTTSNSCSGGSSALRTTMGLSIGWGDKYGYQLPDQYIDITGLVAGRYRLWAEADPANWFLEANEANNVTWVDLQLSGSGLTILGYGPITNLLKNGSFEQDANNDGRPDSWSTNSRFTRSAEAVRSGSYAGKHYATDDGNYAIRQTVPKLTAGSTYFFSSWVNIPSTSDTFTFRLRVIWRDANNNVIRNQILKEYTTATGGWDRVIASRVAPAGTTQAEVVMQVSSLNATVYVDVFALSQ